MELVWRFVVDVINYGFRNEKGAITAEKYCQ